MASTNYGRPPSLSMAPQNSSIHSYFPRQAKVNQKGPIGDADKSQIHACSTQIDGDIEDCTVARRASPRMSIGQLQPGPNRVSVTGRIVNLWQSNSRSKLDAAAKGLWVVSLRDDTGALTVKLWYARTSYALRLGSLARVWTPHVSLNETSSPAKFSTPFVANIFPERDDGTRWQGEVHDDGLVCKRPLNYCPGKPLAGLVTLKTFLDGSHNVTELRILVCVKSIGGEKAVTTKKGVSTQRVDISVFDDTGEVMLSLWNCMIPSTATWKPFKTILLITNPLYKNSSRPSIALQRSSYVDVDPNMDDAIWLRNHAARMSKEECVNPLFDTAVFDVVTAQNAVNSALWALAEVDAIARSAPAQQVTGWLSLTIMEMNFYNLHQRNMLFCSDCCGVPIFANATSAKCTQCHTKTELRLNPKVVGLLIDETGGIAAGKLIWSTEAWCQFLGRRPEEMLLLTDEQLAYIDHRCLFLRIALLFGWDAKVGRLCVLKMTIV